MKPYVLRRQQVIPLKREQVFLFFSRPENLERITPARYGFHDPHAFADRDETGALIDYTIRSHGDQSAVDDSDHHV